MNGTCESTKSTCLYAPRYFVNVETHPTDLPLPDGTTTRESSPAGRSVLVCGKHLPAAVRGLWELPNRTGKPVTVAILRDDE